MSLQRRIVLALIVLGLFPQRSMSQYDPPPVKQPDDKTLLLIQHRTLKLREAIQSLPENVPSQVRADVEIYLKAADWIVRHNEWYHSDAPKWALGVIDQGMQRVAEAGAGKASWLEPKGKMVARAYRSDVDRSLQPYAVTFPSDYGKDPSRKWRLDIVLHGRDSSISEAKFLFQHNGKDPPKDRDYVQIDIFGRGNNAYRWAGETDVFEAIDHFIADEKRQGRDLIDPRRTVLRGFSMGGAGTWHLGLQHPDRWCVIGPGAGFTTTHGYVKGLASPLPAPQEELLHIYDAVDYTENAFNVPVIAYSGEKDPQKAAADNIEKRVKELGISTMTHLIAPGLEHQFPADWQKKAEAEYVRAGAGKGRPDYPEKISFVTYTLKFPKCDWITILGMERHYQKAKVDAERVGGDTLKITTRNVALLQIGLPDAGNNSYRSIVIDGEALAKSSSRLYRKLNGHWTSATAPVPGETKSPGLQGPIDDAFTSAFLCVKGTSAPWHESTGKAVDAQLQRFEREWDLWMRGQLPLKDDKDVTEEDIRTKNLILFGDPASNSLIAKALPKLPLVWDKAQLVLGGTQFEGEKHLPILVYPNPLSPAGSKKYVVLNSGHTFHSPEFRGTNALLFPRLGDFAVVRPIPTEKDPAAFEVMKGGIFDEAWKIGDK